MKLKEIHRTATFAWSPSESIPLLASGTVAGALDESFSNDSQLEIWTPDFLEKAEYDLGGEQQPGPRGAVSTSSRFNRIAWGSPSAHRTRGVIAAGMENGELGLWDPEKILTTSDATESLVFRNTTHQGSIRGLDFNPIQTNLFSSGANNGEIYIWDLKDPSKPYSPGTRSSKLDEITALAWNRQVQHVLASSSSTGYTVVWDLRGKREVVALTYGGGGGGFGGPAQGGRSMGGGGRRGMSDVAWHPDNATRLVTSSEDDSAPIVMVWDLRNARAPEKILTGHEKGVLSLSWCKQDADLLLSCGKDNRALCWNPQTSEVIGELPSAENWAFQVQWCPRNPDLLATAYFDGTIGIHSLQSTNEETESSGAIAPTPQADGSDVFDVPGFSRSTQPTLSLKQPPKWLRRPISASFGYGGKIVSVANLPSAQGKTQSSVVHMRTVVTEPTIVDRAHKLQSAQDGQSLNAFAEERSKEIEKQAGGVDSASWKALLSLFRADSREELVTLLGFSKEEIAARVEEAVEKIKASAAAKAEEASASRESDIVEARSHLPVVSFAEPEREDNNIYETSHDADSEGGAAEPTPSEQSAGAPSDVSDLTKLADGESTTTAPSLFGDDVGMGTPQTDAAADFFSSMGTTGSALPDHVQVPHVNYAHDSSVAATIGSRPSSVASADGVTKNTFKIYPSEEFDVDRLITKALVMGDFESAVTLCLAGERFADAILLAVKGGSQLLERTQKAYFEKRTSTLPYLRLFQSIVTNDLEDIVQNADLQEWREIFVVLCTFAKPDEFANLAEQLGQRLEFHGTLSKQTEAAEAEEFRKHATLTYLAAGRLEKVVNIWIEEMAEEEQYTTRELDDKRASLYSAHAHALQTFIEKVTVFRNATKYVDGDLNGATTSEETASVRSYKLSGLYDRYYEYADLLAAQGLVSEAVKFLKLTPDGYQGSPGSKVDFVVARERLLAAAGLSGKPKAAPAVATTSAQAPSYAGYSQYPAPIQQQAPVASMQAPLAPRTTAYGSYGVNGSATSSGPTSYAPATTHSQPSYQPTAPMQYATYGSAAPYGQTQQAAPAPPPAFGAPPQAGLTLPPPPKKQENGGWNDAPAMIPERRTPTSLNLNKPAAITSPFPNSTPLTPSLPSTPALRGQPPAALPPPPRPGSVARGSPQPFQGTQQPPMPHGPQSSYGLQRSMSPGQGIPPAPPSRFAGPPQGQPAPPQFAAPTRALSPPRQTPPSQFAPQMRGPGGPPAGPPGHSAPPGPYGRGTPPQGQGAPHRGTPPPGQMSREPPPPPSGPYGPPPGHSRMGAPPGPGMGPGGNMGPGGPPPPAGPPRGPPAAGASPTPAPAAPKGPPPPKYPPGDRSHIPDDGSRQSFMILSERLNHLKQIAPPQQKRVVDEIERRLNVLFDALNCGTLSPEVIASLSELTSVIASGKKMEAMKLHGDLLISGSRTAELGIWMSGVKQIIQSL